MGSAFCYLAIWDACRYLVRRRLRKRRQRRVLADQARVALHRHLRDASLGVGSFIAGRPTIAILDWAPLSFGELQWGQL